MKPREMKLSDHPTRCTLLSTLDGGEFSWELRVHLRSCNRCAQRFELLRSMGSALRELPHPAWLERGLRSTPELRERILERLRSETRRHLAGWLRDFVAHSLVLLGHSPASVKKRLAAAPAAGKAGQRGAASVSRALTAESSKRGASSSRARSAHSCGDLARFELRGVQRGEHRGEHLDPPSAARRALIDVLVDIGRMAQRARRTRHAAEGLPLAALPLRLPTALTAEAAVRRVLAVAPEFEIGEQFVAGVEALLARVPASESASAPAAAAHGGLIGHGVRHASARRAGAERAARQYPTAAPSLRDSLAPR